MWQPYLQTVNFLEYHKKPQPRPLPKKHTDKKKEEHTEIMNVWNDWARTLKDPLSFNDVYLASPALIFSLAMEFDSDKVGRHKDTLAQRTGGNAGDSCQGPQQAQQAQQPSPPSVAGKASSSLWRVPC